MSICVPETPSRAATASWRSATSFSPRHALGRLLQLLILWRARQRDRRDLLRLPNHLLRDIGLNVEDARQESRKPFWQA